MASRYTYAHTNLNDTNIAFKSGTQSSLNNLITDGTAVEGAFYLTTDTHRLYIGREITADGETSVSKTIPVPINEGIQTVTSVSDLPNNANSGEFYYIESSNVLAVRSGNTWVQLNPDTNNDTQVTNFNITAGSLTNGSIVYTWTLDQVTKDIHGNDLPLSNQPAQLTGTFSVNASDIAKLAKVGLTSSAPSNNSTTISTTGNANGDTVSLTGGNGITLSGSTDSLTITGTTYGLSNAAVSGSSSTNTADIVLTGSNKDTNTVSIKTSGENLAIDNTVANAITVKHTTAGTETGGIFGNNTTTTLEEGGTFKIPKITKDANGHIKSISDTTITLPTAGGINSVGAGNDGVITITTNGGDQIKSGADLYYTISVDGTNQTISNQGSLGTFYSAGQVDTLIESAKKEINAMTYKGTVGNSASTLQGNTLPTTGVSVGDTYAVNGAGTINGQACNVGDIFIAQGTEDSDTGYITTGSLTWDRIAAGDIDTQYQLTLGSGNNPTVDLQTTGGTSTGKFQIVGEEDIEVTGTVASGANPFKITIKHSNSTANIANDQQSQDPYGPNNTTAQTLSSAGTFNVPNFKVDAQGHVVSAGTKTYTLPASNNTTYTLINASSTGTNPTYDTKIHLLDNNGNSAGTPVEFVASNNGLVVSSEANKIKYGHCTPTLTTPTAPAAAVDIPAAGITVVTGLTRDDYGHVTGYNINSYKVPTAVTYSLKTTAMTSGVNKVNWQLQNSAHDVLGIVTMDSSTLAFSANTATTGTTAYTVDLKWGTF